MKISSILSLAGKRPRGYKIPGGIKPLAFKAASLRSRIMPMPIPDTLLLPLTQYQNDPSIPIVKVGDLVRKYQKLASADGPNSIALHAPTSGMITEIGAVAAAGSDEVSIVLESDGLDSALELTPVADFFKLNYLQLLELIAAAGISGMGGAGFSTTRKLRLSNEKGIELLIINAAECEPYITADEALLREHAAEVVLGAEILQASCQAARCIIAIEDSKTDAIAALKKVLPNSRVEVLIVTAKYPSGGEKQLVQAVTGLEVPTGSYPVDIGMVMHNVGTAYAVYKAIIIGEPCISRITTLTGTPLKTPKNFEVLIGTSIAFLFKLCGIDHHQHTGTILGGSLMGIELASSSIPIVKTSNCIIAKSVEEFPEPLPEQACIRCGFCANACPVSLLPQQLYSFARTRNHEALNELGLFDCIECGACAYVCPSQIPLVQYYRASKAEMVDPATEQRREYLQARFQYHQYRIKQQQDESVERHRSKVIIQSAEKSQPLTQTFSRELARQEIAASIARNKTKQEELRTARDSAAKRESQDEEHN